MRNKFARDLLCDPCFAITVVGLLDGEKREELTPHLHVLKLQANFVAKQPAFVGDVWRGVNVNCLAKYQEMMEKEARFRDWRFTSTSTDMGVVKSFLKGKDYNVLFCIKCTSGVRIHELSAFPAESEVVLMPGVQYVVRS